MAGIGVAPHVIEACLNHVSGAKASVAGIYNPKNTNRKNAPHLNVGRLYRQRGVRPRRRHRRTDAADLIVTPDNLKDLPAHLYIEEMWLPEWRKRRQKQIDNAVAIINPQPRQREACREDVERKSLRLFAASA